MPRMLVSGKSFTAPALGVLIKISCLPEDGTGRLRRDMIGWIGMAVHPWHPVSPSLSYPALGPFRNCGPPERWMGSCNAWEFGILPTVPVCVGSCARKPCHRLSECLLLTGVSSQHVDKTAAWWCGDPCTGLLYVLTDHGSGDVDLLGDRLVRVRSRGSNRRGRWDGASDSVNQR
jgi:hypothetical protein